MARIRTIKPDFWKSDPVVRCSLPARLLFIGIWNFADDGGVFPASCSQIKREVFPDDVFDAGAIEGMIAELLREKLLMEFDGPDGKHYWYIRSFKEHQRVDRPTYKYPTPPDAEASQPSKKSENGSGDVGEHSSNTPRTVADKSESDRRALTPGMEGNGNGSGKGNLKPGSSLSARKPPVAKSCGAMVGPVVAKSRGLRREKKRAGAFDELTRNDLRDTSRLVQWFHRQAMAARPVIGSAEMDLLNVVGAAERAMEVGVNAVALFASIVGGKRWRLVSLEQEDRARLRLREWRNGVPRASPIREGEPETLGSILACLPALSAISGGSC